jgi:NAD-dependent dihydropyrimidine dehydrogenase PreA subunit
VNRKAVFFKREHTRTQFVKLDTQKCKACWECINNCSNQVINKIDLPWHKHALIVEPSACTGCLNCVSICQYGAYSIYDRANQKAEKPGMRTFNNFLINNLLLISGFVMIFSGLVLQLGFHMSGSDKHQIGVPVVKSQSIGYEQIRGIDRNAIVYGLSYSDWSTTHKFTIVFFSLLMACHIYIHWKWYNVVITKHLVGKNRQVIILSVLFLLVAATGFIPWFIDLSEGNSIIRRLFIEIHDKLTLIFIVFLILHFVKRARWFGNAYAKLNCYFNL